MDDVKYGEISVAGRRRYADPAGAYCAEEILADLPKGRAPDSLFARCRRSILLFARSADADQGPRTLLAALAYFVLPIDMIPDVFVGIGFSDDIAVLSAAFAMVSQPHQAEALPIGRQRARRQARGYEDDLERVARRFLRPELSASLPKREPDT